MCGFCCLGDLRGLWGFCTRVELGGYMTCGVFASLLSVFPLLCPLSCPLSCPFVPVFASFYARCPSLLWLSLFVLLHCLCVFFFPFGLYAKKKGRKGFAPCVLSSCVMCVQILVTLSKNSLAVYLAFSSSFGWYSQLIQHESEGLPVFTLIFSGIMSI